ncbi:MAG: PD-(D/E)XK nuclease family protein [Euryarchaeota archaeon]|nr:PD-(D/E)XK nuclease family protein [Euryarchaeota archaeon]
MAKRIQSPSSINTYKQCPRRYFYLYALRLPTKPSIHLIRGSIVHEVLENFFDININSLDKKDYKFGFRSYILAHLSKLWKQNSSKFSKLSLTKEQIEHYFVESHEMLNNFIESFSEKLEKRLKKTNDLEESFKQLTPFVEEEIVNQELAVRGFIDAIHDEGEGIVIIDYKTSNKDDISPEYRLQLGIYALLYQQKYGKAPDKVGINFLKFSEVIIDVDESLLEEAKHEIMFVHEMTQSDNIIDYPKKESGLCKWSGGECDFYGECARNNH